MNLLIIGSGGHAKVVAETASLMKIFSEIAFLDDKFDSNIMNQSELRWKIVGNLSDITSEHIKKKYSHAFVGIGDVTARERFLNILKVNNYLLATIIHPSSYVSPSAKIGKGSVVLAKAAIQTNCLIGLGCIINTSSSLDHDVIIKDFVHISPGANIAGNTKIESRSWIGIGASVIQGLHIGKDVIIGAGAAVVNNLPNNVTVVGVPAKNIDTKN